LHCSPPPVRFSEEKKPPPLPPPSGFPRAAEDITLPPIRWSPSPPSAFFSWEGRFLFHFLSAYSIGIPFFFFFSPFLLIRTVSSLRFPRRAQSWCAPSPFFQSPGLPLFLSFFFLCVQESSGRRAVDIGPPNKKNTPPPSRCRVTKLFLAPAAGFFFSLSAEKKNTFSPSSKQSIVPGFL